MQGITISHQMCIIINIKIGSWQLHKFDVIAAQIFLSQPRQRKVRPRRAPLQLADGSVACAEAGDV